MQVQEVVISMFTEESEGENLLDRNIWMKCLLRYFKHFDNLLLIVYYS